MDAPQVERDIKLQRVSSDLLAELVDSLPGFLWRRDSSNGDLRHVRRSVKQRETARLITIVGMHYFHLIWSNLTELFFSFLQA
jgi:hypothetical protein